LNLVARDDNLCVKCGNGELDIAEGEECDDNNHIDGDGCSAYCVVEVGFICES